MDDITPNLIVTWSSDRTLKLWDFHTRELTSRVVQTLSEHSGTITNVIYMNKCLISCSTDGTIKIWKSNERHLLLYPWYQCIQTLNNNSGLRSCPNTLSSYICTEQNILYVGDDKGRLYTISSPDKINLQIQHSLRIHTLSITHILMIPCETLIITLSYDHTIQIHDAYTNNGFFAIENPTRCRYTDMCWNEEYKELYLVDEFGYLQVWNIYVEKCLKSIRVHQGMIIA
jgi:WD40 repeat protein